MLWNSHEHKEALSEDEINGNDNQQRQLVDLTTSDVGITNPTTPTLTHQRKTTLISFRKFEKGKAQSRRIDSFSFRGGRRSHQSSGVGKENARIKTW